jgi:hypothetical protein
MSKTFSTALNEQDWGIGPTVDDPLGQRVPLTARERAMAQHEKYVGYLDELRNGTFVVDRERQAAWADPRFIKMVAELIRQAENFRRDAEDLEVIARVFGRGIGSRS